MKLHLDKCYLLVSGFKYEQTWTKIEYDKIWEIADVKRFNVKIDNLKFDNHVSKLYSKAISKLTALSRLSKFLSFEKPRVLFKAFVKSQFKYYPLIWMFHS